MGQNLKLTIELIPSTSFYKNVRSEVSKTEWNKIKKRCYVKAESRCEICGGIGHNHPVECHEIWEYDDKRKTQTLTGFIALCPDCHTTKHAGLAAKRGCLAIVVDQLAKVNNMSAEEVEQYILQSFDIWHERSNHKWKINIDYLKHYTL